MVTNIWIINILNKHAAQNPCSEAKSNSDRRFPTLKETRDSSTLHFIHYYAFRYVYVREIVLFVLALRLKYYTHSTCPIHLILIYSKFGESQTTVFQ